MGKIKDYLVELDDEKLLAEVESQLEAGTPPEDILAECQEGMIAIGEAFSEGTMFVSDLMMSGALFKDVSALIMPKLAAGGDGSTKGVVVMGTVKDDIHDIGKDIVVNLLRAAGFEVQDVGIDAPAESFVKAVQDSGAKVLGLSCLLVNCYPSILETVEALKTAGLRDNVKVIIGGGPIDQHVVEYSGADAFGADAQAAVNYCKEVYAS